MSKIVQDELADAVTGEIFQPHSRNHYEVNDGIPKAPAVDLPRPTLRQRVEWLTRQQPDVLARYMHDGTSDRDYDVPEDDDAPLTPSEANYLDMIASDVAESAPLPDDGLPAATQLPPVSPPKAADAPGGGSPPPPPPPAAK